MNPEVGRMDPSGRGRRLSRIGATLFWIALACTIVPIGMARFLPWWGPLALCLIATLFVFLGIALRRRGRKLMAAGGEQVLAHDARPPVVYLRSFSADALGTKAVGLSYRYSTEEEQLAMVLRSIGPFVAIGDPSESLPDLGAARIYVHGEDWKRKVLDLIRRAELVVVRAGVTEGFWWELGVVRDRVPPEKVLLLAPANRAEYDAFRSRAAGVFPHRLPESIGGKRLTTHIGGVIEFDSAWHPRLLPIRGSFTRSKFTAPQMARLSFTLQPVFDRLGIAWPRPPVAHAKMAVLAVSSAVFALAVAVWLAIRIPEWTYHPAPVTPPVETAAAPPQSVELSPYDAALQKYTARLGQMQEFRAAAGRAGNRTEARALGRQLSQAGLRRLSDERLIQRATLVSHLVNQAGTETCAAIMKGRSVPGIESTLRQLPPEEIGQWFDISFEAIQSELSQAPAPAPPSQEQLNQAMKAMLALLPPAEGQLLISVLTSRGKSSDTTACNAARLMYTNIPDLPDPHRAIFARMLVLPE